MTYGDARLGLPWKPSRSMGYCNTGASTTPQWCMRCLALKSDVRDAKTQISGKDYANWVAYIISRAPLASIIGIH